MKTFKYRLQPSKSQRRRLIQTLELCRWVYNETLATRKNAWEQTQITLSLYDTHKLLPNWKQEHPELKGVYSQVLQNVQERVDLAFKAFFRRTKTGEKPGYPRFRVGMIASPFHNSVLQCYTTVCFFPKLEPSKSFFTVPSKEKSGHSPFKGIWLAIGMPVSLVKWNLNLCRSRIEPLG
jgi:hypothetical protein